MASLGQNPFTAIKKLTFKIYSDEDIKKLSSLCVTVDESVNPLGHYVEGGVYDLHMGPMSHTDEDACKTCNQKFYKCTGHCGHIDLILPVYNPFFIDVLQELLSKTCFSCRRYQVKVNQGIQFVYESHLINAGCELSALEVTNIATRFLNNSEAVESRTGANGNEEQTMNAVVQSTNLLKMLRKQYKQTKKEVGDQFKEPTCNSQAIYMELRKKFFSETALKSKAKCLFCKQTLLNVRVQNSQLMVKNVQKCQDGKNSNSSRYKTGNEESLKDSAALSQPFVTAKQAMDVLRLCYKKDGIIIGEVYPFLKNSPQAHPTDQLFINKLIVIPPRYRPCNKVNGAIIENELSVLYKTVIRYTKCLSVLVAYRDKDISTLPETLLFLINELKGNTLEEKSHTIWHQLQGAVDSILDSELNPSMRVLSKGIRQIVEKKFGLFRRNLMGKRVNFSARSVAAPDPLLAVDEVGVPVDFAMKLSYPVAVTQWNAAMLRELVKRGPCNYPGALMVEDEEGRKVQLKSSDYKQRSAIANCLLTPAASFARRVNVSKIVYRHLQNGDYVLMNRQPTLHKPSIQAHKARVMPKDRVLRMPYANCKAYNADFDGDELNLHFPQNEMARSESKYIINTQHQYLTPKDGSPLAGLIQDCVVGSVMLTMRGNFFSKEDYQQLVYVAVSELPRAIKLLPPSILKPQVLWSGKQIISTILLNLIPESKIKPTFKFRTFVKPELWQQRSEREWMGGGDPEIRKESMTESEFIMRDGELLCGVIDKCAIGSTSYSLVHICYELYGAAVASQLLTAIGRLCVSFLQWTGHTISLKEFTTPEHVSEKRRKTLKELIETAEDAVSKKLNIPKEELAKKIEFFHLTNNEKEMSVIDAAYTSVLGPTTSRVTSENEKGLYRNNLQNRMRMMVDTGAKGSKVNMNQMASLFGSVAIDGKRMPMSITGKTLPSFKRYETNPRAGGYIPTRFVTGMDLQSYFFLCIVGRDSLQHTAVKTANSGYIQRCMIKHLEGISVGYDMTVRNSDKVVLQFQYGEDGQDVTKVPFLKNMDSIDAIVDNYWRLQDENSKAIALSTKNPMVKKYKKQVKKLKNSLKEKRSSGFLRFCCILGPNVLESNKKFNETGKSEQAISLQKKWYELSLEERAKFSNIKKKCPDPVSSVFSCSSHLGVVSEALDDLIEKYYEEIYSRRPIREQYMLKKDIINALHMKALSCRVDPGEAVGALCAQAIGEPLTQMTLNTFHFAGRDELNVTLGVPRMIEILRTASENILTPIMEVPFRSGVSLKTAEALKVKLTPVFLAKVVHNIKVTSSLQISTQLFRRTQISFNLLPHKEYRKMFAVKPEGVLKYIENFFISQVLIKEIRITLKKVRELATSTRENNVNDDDDPKDKELDKEIDKENPVQEDFTRNIKLEDEELTSEEEDNEEVMDMDVISAARQKKKQEADYSEDDEKEENVENIIKAIDLKSVPIKKEKKSPNTSLAEDEVFFCDIVEILPHIKKELNGVPKEEEIDVIAHSENAYKCRRNKVIAKDNWIVNYECDDENFSWCKVTLNLPIAEGKYDLASILKKVIENSLVHSIPGIKRAFVVEKENYLLLRTEGVNIYKMCDYEHILDINRLYTNNIHLMAKTFGIEAAQRTIIKEIRAVQSAYDIKVDFRHLSLLADYFVCEGTYKACSRFALNTCASPIQKMSYETCFGFLKTALIQGHSDTMSSPSAAVMVGQPVRVGTNSMGLLSKLNFKQKKSCLV